MPEKKCSRCHGAGRVQEIENIAINIPDGIHNGETISISGKGEAPYHTARGAAGEGGYGDLYVYIHIKKHPFFERDGDDIFSDSPISFSQAALGDNILVKTLGGEVLLKIPAGIESGEMLKLNGKGMPRLHGSGYGDQYVKIIVNTPKRLSRRAKELIEELKKEGV